MPYLSIIIPAYNEEARIGPTLERICGYLRARECPCEIVVVDDGSSDGTVAVVEAVRCQEQVAVRVLRNEVNRGKGYSVRRGALESRGRMVLFSDADLSTPIEELSRLLIPLESGEADIAIASRGLPDSDLVERQPLWREMMGRTFNKLVRLLAVSGFSDTQCGFKLFTRAAAEAVFPRQYVERWAFDVELLFIAHRLKLRVAEVPVRWVNSPASKVSPLGDASRMLVDVARLRLRALRGAYREPHYPPGEPSERE
jgi:dolichyl-phosphate beta-glucosyltransferase